jgi:hypothetical protein
MGQSNRRARSARSRIFVVNDAKMLSKQHVSALASVIFRAGR